MTTESMLEIERVSDASKIATHRADMMANIFEAIAQLASAGARPDIGVRDLWRAKQHVDAALFDFFKMDPEEYEEAERLRNACARGTNHDLNEDRRLDARVNG